MHWHGVETLLVHRHKAGSLPVWGTEWKGYGNWQMAKKKKGGSHWHAAKVHHKSQKVMQMCTKVVGEKRVKTQSA